MACLQGVIMKSALLSVFLVPILIALLAFSGCSDSDDSGPTSPNENEEDPILSVSVSSLVFEEDDNTLQFVVSNDGGQELEWTITTDVDWLSVFPASGVTRDEEDAVTVTVDRTDMIHGNHSGTITLTTTDDQIWNVGVAMTVPAPDPVILVHWENVTLDENHWRYSSPVEIPYEGILAMNMDLNDWPGDYGLELFVMSPAEYDDYADGENFSVYWHETISTQGQHVRVAPNLIAAETMVVIVVDNTDKGWEDTDFDFWNDDARFDLEVALGPLGD